MCAPWDNLGLCVEQVTVQCERYSKTGSPRAARFKARSVWLEKVWQLNQIQKLHHGPMLVGPSGSGKTAGCKVLIKLGGRDARKVRGLCD